MVKQLETKAEFDETLQSDKLVVVDFTATWCPPCQRIAPKFAELAESLGEAAVLVKVDVDENSEVSQACDARAYVYTYMRRRLAKPAPPPSRPHPHPHPHSYRPHPRRLAASRPCRRSTS